MTIPFTKPSLTADDMNAVMNVLKSDLIGRGPIVEEFENALAEFCGAQFAVTFNAGSTGMLAACHAAGVRTPDRLLTTPNACMATVSPGMQAGATPVFIDIDATSGNIDLEKLAPNFEETSTRGKAVVIVNHYAGIPVNMELLEEKIADLTTLVIEEAYSALGSSYNAEQRVGCCDKSLMTVFSFHGPNLITTGEGGAVTTNDPELYQRLKRTRDSGRERDPERLEHYEGPWSHEVKELSCNYQMTDIQAALGLSQLRRIEESIAKRQEILGWYQQQLADLRHIQLLQPLLSPLVAPQMATVLIDFAACKRSRAELMTSLQEQGIASKVCYIPLYRQPVLRNICGDLTEYFPANETFYSQVLCLPLYVTLQEEDVVRICKALSACL